MYRHNLRITEYAEQDLEDIGDYIAFELKNFKFAVQVIQDLRREIAPLATLPECHELDEDDVLTSSGVRKCHHKNYKIYYMLQKQMDAAIILRIPHVLVDSRAKLYRLFGIQIE